LYGGVRRQFQTAHGEQIPSVKIIHKYVLREHAGPLVFALSALTSLLLLNYIAKQFGNLVGKGLPWAVIGQFFGLSVPFTLAMTLPMAVLVSTLYAFSRLAAENEVTALKANGVSVARLTVPVLGAAFLLSAFMVFFNDQVLPRANHKLRTLQGDIARKKPTFALREQVINEVAPGKLFLRANHLDEFSNRMRDVTIYDIGDPLRRRTIYADSGNLAFAPNNIDLQLTLYHGHMLEVPRDKPLQLQRLYYDVDFIRVDDVANQLDLTAHDTFKSDREMSVCELQNEVSRNEILNDRAKVALRQTLLSATREAVSGARAVLPADSGFQQLMTPGTRAPRSRHVSLGRVYCDAVGIARRIRPVREPAVPPKSVRLANQTPAPAAYEKATQTAVAAARTATPQSPSMRARGTRPGVMPKGAAVQQSSPATRPGTMSKAGTPLQAAPGTPLGTRPAAVPRYAAPLQAAPGTPPGTRAGVIPKSAATPQVPSATPPRTDSAYARQDSAATKPVLAAGVPHDTTAQRRDTVSRRDSVATPRPIAPPTQANINPQVPVPPVVAQDTSKLRADSAASRDSAKAPRIAPPTEANINPQLPDLPPVATPSPRVAPNDTAAVRIADSLARAHPALGVGGVAVGGMLPSQPFVMSAAIDAARARILESASQRNQNAVELHKKFAISVACFIFVLVGAPIALRFPRGGVGLVIGVSLVVFAIYYIGLIAGESLGDRGIIQPAFAMWAANGFLALVGLVLLARIGREGATARGGDLGDLVESIRGLGRIFRFRRSQPA
jgi:lipopolysaccharide export system permease protein